MGVTETRRLVCCVAAALMLQAVPVRGNLVTIVETGPSSNRVDMLFLGDGYTASQIDTLYVQHVNNALNHMFAGDEDPYPRYQNFFNIRRIDVVSSESGADKPPEGIYRDTALDATYYSGGTERRLTINTTKADDQIRAAFGTSPILAEMRLVTVNDSKYGGSGGDFAVYSGANSSAGELALHESAHGFAGLADEYVSYDTPYTGGEPIEPNVTKSSIGAKWAPWIGYDDPDHPEIGPIGVFEGAKYYPSGLYRPSLNSKMRSLGRPFDAVSREQIILEIYDYVDPLDDWLSNAQPLVDPAALWVDVIDPAVIQVQWSIDAVPIDGASDESFDLLSLVPGPGSYQASALAFDDTDWVRRDLQKLFQTMLWDVTVTGPGMRRPGDLGGDGYLTLLDIDPFVLAMTDVAQYVLAYPLVDLLAVGDLNGDDAVNLLDINNFVSLLAASGAATVPEPTTPIIIIALTSLALRRRPPL